MLEFAGFHAGLCRTLLAQMSEFADNAEILEPSFVNSGDSQLEAK
jgi:hypothetical protein